ncbi:hypothetical protein Z959_05190 [Clostridium novyi B str. ATCC 27606]|uniref:DUF3793 domain-containing protein n=2 Tax=Clostridium TaxID=1485 RepID=A0AA40IRY9_CLONO|nr:MULTISPECIES: DUF3793 family protein [Clostridium]KEI12108.1 hypothetical protein Z959_05190 [Clostridium novyi B str. ATCC 27606]KEI13309.1 hypothetical protein Z958_03600 [Clostridium novyi B str. NCTC 9691]KEI15028.1 hypothetical protein Z960_01455 [Clostridium haemolyticum NCTC 9693]KGN01344.1 hypothetical protein Z961_09130 [Clostridium haemolyticum NCTC 8350]CAG7840116.1 hypothetical protein CLOHAE12215_01532 [Clostridium haemolyticum]
MSKCYLEAYMKTMDSFSDKDYLLSTILYSIAPTLAGEKVSSLVNFNKTRKRNLYSFWMKYKEEIIDVLNIEYFELKKTEDMCVVLFYNDNQLTDILSNARNQKFLSRFNYSNFNSNIECLEILKERYANLCPHEIGIFLGYPLKDVIDFVECPNKQCLLLGYWKVYNDIKDAQIKFNKFDSIKDKVVYLMVQGTEPSRILSYI